MIKSLSGICLLILGFLPANAQVPDDSISYELSPVVISALRMPVKESTAPYGMVRLQIRKNTQGLSLAETLAGVPGLQVQARYNLSVGDRISNRGFGARTQFGVRGIRIIVDDVPATMADGQTNLEIIDLHDLYYMELLRGPGSSLYGNSSGGVLRLYTNPLSSDPFLFSVSSTIGPDGFFRWNGTAGVTAAKTRFSFSYTGFNYAGFRKHSNSEFNRGMLKLQSTLSTSDRVSLRAGFVSFKALSPGALTEAEVKTSPRLANPFSINNKAGEDGIQVQASADWIHRFDSISQLKTNIYDSYRYVRNLIAGKIIDLPQNSGGLDAIWEKRFILYGKTINWNSGINLEFRFNNRKNWVNTGGEKGEMNLNQDESVINTGLFTQFIFQFIRKVNIAASIRYDMVGFDVTDRLSNTGDIDNTGNRRMSDISPSAGIIYSPSDLMSLFGNISTSFETPTSTELANRPGSAGGFNPDLQPSRALEYEVGIRGRFNSLLHYDLTGYIIQIRDELIPFEVLPDLPGGQVYYRNAGSSLHKGAEMMISFFPVAGVEARVSTTYLNAVFKKYRVNEDDYSGKKVPGIYPVQITGEMVWNAPFGLRTSLLSRSFGTVYADDANTAKVNPYMILEFDISHHGIELGGRTRLIFSGGISNLLDRNYISSVTVNANAERYYEPGPGRSFFLNAKFEYK